MTPIVRIKACIDGGKNFVLQGGAGSGKTETLKQALEYVAETYPMKRVACITHTNLAVNEIRARVRGDYTIITIHSFLNAIISDFKRNLRDVISVIYETDRYDPVSIEDAEHDDKEFRQLNYDAYKKSYNSWASKRWSVRRERSPKVQGKREFDLQPIILGENLNAEIDDLNAFIRNEVSRRDYSLIQYNDTPFNDYGELTYGHDGLLKITKHLFQRFPTIGKILQDKYDYIFIDEYQDTNPDIVEVFLTLPPSVRPATIGLFGDSMQAIYEDGVGDVNSYIQQGTIVKIEKEDNYRCSPEVIQFVNRLRDDGLLQEVAYKNLADGSIETPESRLGSVTLLYSIYGTKPHMRSSKEEKDMYSGILNRLIDRGDASFDNLKHLKLTNRSISGDVGFKRLYEVFADRDFDPKDSIEKNLSKLQLKELYELYSAFERREYNYVLTSLQRHGSSVKSLRDKIRIAEDISHFDKYDGTAVSAIEHAFSIGLLKKSESFSNYMHRRSEFLSQLSSNSDYQSFKNTYEAGNGTFTRMKKVVSDLEEDDFNDQERDFIQERFYLSLFDEVTLSEVFQYFRYGEEKTKYITMHKTKGSGIENVLVVLDEYFWNDYDFKSVYQSPENAKQRRKRLKNLKLVYVACSRAKKNLVCIKLIEPDEEEKLIKLFHGASIEKIPLEQLASH